MKTGKIKRCLAGVLCVVLLLAALPMSTPAQALSVANLVDSYTVGTGSFTLKSTSRFFIEATTEPSADVLRMVKLSASEFAADGKPTATSLDICWGHADAADSDDIRIRMDNTYASESYRLEITSDGVIVIAGDHSGVRYGLITLLKQMRLAGSTTVSACTITDAPDTVERTVHLDCARKYFTKDWICNFIREMSWMGYNALEIHFSEDGGFRLDLWDPDYYKGEFKPINDFSWICGSHVQYWVGTKYANDPDAGKYLTTAEMIEIIQTAKDYNIEVIPSFDSPAHMDYLCWKYEQHYNELLAKGEVFQFQYGNDVLYSNFPESNGSINYKGTVGSATPKGPDYTTIDIDQNTYHGRHATRFVFALYLDIANFFKEYAGSTKFNIGADEVNLSASNLLWNYDMFPGYVTALNDLLKSRGYKVRMYNDFIGSTAYDSTNAFPDDVEIVYWNSPLNVNTNEVGGDENKVETVQYFVNQGKTLYNAVQSNTYYVLRVADKIDSDDANYMKDGRDPSNTNWQFYHSTEKDIYNEWYPADISEHGIYSENVADVPADQLGGGYFLLWNDYAAVDTETNMWNRTTYSLRNRMWSNIIKMWNWDVSAGLTYDDYAKIRSKLGDFPGYSDTEGSAAKYTLPTAEEAVHVYRADHAALQSLLAVKQPAASYTDDSYAAYESAWNAAKTVDENYDASADEISAAAAALQAATEGLTVRDVTLTVTWKGRLGSVEKVLSSSVRSLKWGEAYSVTVEQVDGFEFVRADGGTVVNGTISGTMEQDALQITLWYDCLLSFEELATALDGAPTEQGSYSDESWRDYQSEYNRINALYTDAMAAPGSVTQEQLDEAVLDLQIAVAKLAYGEVKLTIRYLTNVGGNVYEISADTYYWPGMTRYTFPAKHLKNYQFSHATGAEITFVDEGANIGSLSGLLEEETVIELWYNNAPSIAELELLLAGAPAEQGSFTDASWAAYQTVLGEVQEFYNANSINTALKVRQSQIDEKTAALEATIRALTIADEEAGVQIMEAKALSATVAKGRQAVICLVTSADVESITVTCGDEQIELRKATADLVENSDGQMEKRWMISFCVDTAGTYTYVVHAVGDGEEATAGVSITCQ